MGEIMFVPCHSLVTVVLDPKPTTTKGGLAIPETAQATYRTGIVRAVGPEVFELDCDDTAVTFEIGQRVMIGVQIDPRTRTITNLGTIIDDDGQEVALVNFHDIWGTCDRAAGEIVKDYPLAKA
jgi:co-chaperonin GroES (HSP10)